MANLAFLCAGSMASPAIQRCLRVTHSRTVVHVTYYTANAAPAVENAVYSYIGSQANYVWPLHPCTISVISRDANDIIMISPYYHINIVCAYMRTRGNDVGNYKIVCHV